MWFRERSVLRHRARALLVVGLALALLVAGIAVDPLRVPAVLLVVLALPAVVTAATVGLRAGDVWGLDGGFALAVRPDGLVLPRFGFVPYDDVTAVRVVEVPVAGPVARLQAWLGVRSPRVVHVDVVDVEAYGARVPERWARPVVRDGRPTDGWAFAPEAQLEDGAYDDVLAALREHAPHLLG